MINPNDNHEKRNQDSAARLSADVVASLKELHIPVEFVEEAAKVMAEYAYSPVDEVLDQLTSEPFQLGPNGEIIIPRFSAKVKQCLDYALELSLDQRFASLVDELNQSLTERQHAPVEMFVCLGKGEKFFNEHSWVELRSQESPHHRLVFDPALQRITAGFGYKAEDETNDPAAVQMDTRTELPFTFEAEDIGTLIIPPKKENQYYLVPPRSKGNELLSHSTLTLGTTADGQYGLGLGFVTNKTEQSDADDLWQEQSGLIPFLALIHQDKYKEFITLFNRTFVTNSKQVPGGFGSLPSYQQELGAILQKLTELHIVSDQISPEE
jgi:hypothetical protein